jgi:Sec-independent protein secretion pathway component TatC
MSPLYPFSFNLLLDVARSHPLHLRLVTRTDSLLVLLLVVSVAFQVPVLVVSAWRLVVFNLYQ